MAALNESQIMAQAITLLEEKYSYSVIRKKLGRSKSWISKWAKRYKQSPNETLRNRYHGGRKFVLTAAAQKLIKQSKYRPNSPDLSPIENVWSIMAATVYADPERQTLNILKRRLRKAWTSIG